MLGNGGSEALSDRGSPVVLEALRHKCYACKAEPGVYCTNTVNGQPLIELGRWIHFYRIGGKP